MNELLFKNALENAYLERRRLNRRYSLRRFAEQVGVSHATLSHLMRGTRKITPKMATKLSQVLNMPNAYSMHKEVDGAGDEALNVKVQSLQIFSLIADWYHDAILELTHIPHLSLSVEKVATLLELDIVEARSAVERLQSLGLLEIRKEKWKDVSRNVTIPNTNVTTMAQTRLQQQLLNKALDALAEIPKDRRDHSSLTFAVAEEDFIALKEMIRKFRSELNAFSQRPGVKADSVYQLTVSLFPLVSNLKIKVR